MTAPHLVELPLPIVLALSKHVHDVGAMMYAVRTENLAFVSTQTPHDASRTAVALRALIATAEAAAFAYEMAAKVKETESGS